MIERLDRFMARANAAYYASRDPFRDFTTSPEIAQMFGEIVGAWAAVVWGQLGAPDPVLVIEAGPGRGTLMADALRCVRRVAPAFARALRLHLVETSPRLREAQRAIGLPAAWHDAIEAVPPGPCIVIANEFLDALPIRQFVRRAAGWCERHVEAGKFADIAMPGMVADAPVGAVLELGEAAAGWVASLSARLQADRGVALLLDYGRAQSGPSDSLQALRHGRPADPLQHPGEADLTAHVDFEAIGTIARRAGAAVWGPLAQGVILRRLGLDQRTARLAAANPQRAADLRDGASRLASPARMGDLFKGLCLTHTGAPLPPGFEPARPEGTAA